MPYEDYHVGWVLAALVIGVGTGYLLLFLIILL